MPTDELKYGIAIGVLLTSVVYWLLGRFRSDDSSQPPEEMDTDDLLASINEELSTVRSQVEELAARAGSEAASTSPLSEEDMMDELAEFDSMSGMDLLDFEMENIEAEKLEIEPEELSFDEEADEGEELEIGPEEPSFDDEADEGEESTNDGEANPD